MRSTAVENGPRRSGDERAAAEEALQRSRDFLHQRLLPDLAAAEARVHVLQQDRAGYQDLARQLRQRRDAAAAAAAAAAGPAEVTPTTTVNAPLGMGIHVPVHVDVGAPIIVSMGLAQTSSTALGVVPGPVPGTATRTAEEMDAADDLQQQVSRDAVASSEDAGLYAELTADEALGFIQKKLPILDKLRAVPMWGQTMRAAEQTS